MKTLWLLLLCTSIFNMYSQSSVLVENKVLNFSIENSLDTIDFIVVDTLLNEKKPIFLWCQGSLPVPLFCEIENYGFYFFGGGIANFDYTEITNHYHLVVISIPATPVIGTKEHINKSFQYVPDINNPRQFSPDYVDADYLENYVNRALLVLNFLQSKKWVSTERLVVAGHSQGSKIATKLAVANKKVTHIGLFAPNPFGRVDQTIREARHAAQMGDISWVEADSLINNTYDFYRKVNNQDSIAYNPHLKAWKTFSETFYDDWLDLNIPIYLAYGTEDRTSDLCDIIPLFFIEKGKRNLTLRRYLGLEQNFFEVDGGGRGIPEKGHWNEVIQGFLKWIDE